MTLDYEEDLKFFRKLYESIDILDDVENIVKLLEAHNEIIQINCHKQKDFLANQTNLMIQYNEI